MYSLELSCSREEAEIVAGELWDWGTVAISETESGEEVRLLAGFDTAKLRNELLQRFALFSAVWEKDDTDWEQQTRNAWPPREVGHRIFLTPPWCEDQTPPGRVRIFHTPGAASGTGEHPCTQLALEALESLVGPQSRVADVGTGSGILAIAALQLGAAAAMAMDTEFPSLSTARDNFELNGLRPTLVAGSADCIESGFADITVANISGTVLLSILDELLRVTKAEGNLVLTGFTEGEATTFQRLFPQSEISGCNEWRCLIISLSSYA